MIFPVICLDNFFSDPKEIVELSKTYSYKSTKNYPGLRSNDLSENKFFVERLTNKILSVIYPNEFSLISWYNYCSFQKVPPGIDGDGWIHTDWPNQSELTAIIYLSENCNVGTSIYKLKNYNIQKPEKGDLKKDYFLNHEKYKKEDVNKLIKQRDSYNNNFEETINIKGIYNRLVMFDSSMWHAAHINNTDEERLTLISFISKININYSDKQLNYPIPTMNRL